MFGHLKAEDFVNLMEGAEPPAIQKTHLDSCTRCHELWESLRPLYADVSSLDTGIPEPDWEDFRGSVRDRLLSRSVQRESTVRRWTGWAIRPAMAWALSVLLAVGIPTGMFLWHLQKENIPSIAVPMIKTLPAAELVEAGAEKAVFDDVIELNDSEQTQFQQLLEAAQTGTPRFQ